ncbi:uncharacterized protein Rif1 isoform X2 [Atheta coriaria]|uniref:uncharacterized protein Rif1 isoform X2 n=1 Tax=Dalotia coriaria TaxID=877792 RepID=UPI0031F46645
MKFLRVDVELIRALKENCQNVPSKVTYKYMHVRVIPAIFSPVTTDEERQELCSLAVALPMGFAVQFMHKDTQHKYKQEVIQKYIPFIYERANATFRRDWMLMCQTLIHYSGKMLHSDTLLQNSILKVCEDAFKNASVENRCAAFDCWRALIDNYSLERKYIMHPKQTALLLKPLLARISSNRIVAAKKFDTHVHLLMTIGFEKDLLANFLLEAFGPIDEELPEVPRGDVIHCVRDLTVSYPRSTEILLKVLRHEKETCGCANKTLPIADSCGQIKTEVAKWELLVHSVRMCSQLNYVSLAKARSDIIEQITKCLWSSMFKYFRHEKFNDNRVQVMKLIQSAITKVLNSSMMNITYYNIFFKHILTCLVDFLADEAFDADIYKELVLPTIKELMTYQTKFNDKLPATIYDDCVKDIFMYCKQDPQFLDTIISSLNYPLLQCQLAGNAYAFALHEYTKIMDKSPNKYQDETLTNLFTRVVSINCNEKILATDFKEDSQLLESKSIVLMKVLTQLMKDSAMCFGLLKTSAAMLSNIVTLKNISDHVFYVFLLNVITNSLSMIAEDPTDHTTHLIECTNVFITALQQIISAREHHNKLKIDSMQLIGICTHLLKLKMYHVMEFLPDLLRYIDKQRLPRDLYNIFLNMTDAQDTDVSQKAVSVFEEICASGVKFVSPLKGKTSPVMKSDNTNGIVSPKVVVLPQTILPAMSNNANSVRLFGKYFDSPSPKRCRGSILQRTKNMVAEARNLSLALDSSPTSTKSNANVRAIEDISSNAFVPVDKEVVFDKEKMTEQQREKTTKRRDDIPALYQDLSQSQSQSNSTPVNNDLVEMRVTRSSDTGLNLNGLQEVTEENGVTKVVIPSKPGAKRGRKPKRTKSASPAKARPSTFVPIEEYAHDGPLPTPEVKNEMNDLVPSENNSDDIARQKIEKSLKMNIVGSEEFFNLPKSRTRKSRCFDLGTVTYQDFPVLKKRRRRSKIEMNQKSPENLNLIKTDASPEVNTHENKMETTPNKDNNIPETPTIDNVIPETEKQDDTEVNQDESTPKMDATPESQVMATVTQALGKDCESVTVNLYRLPHYSPTKKSWRMQRCSTKKSC